MPRLLTARQPERITIEGGVVELAGEAFIIGEKSTQQSWQRLNLPDYGVAKLADTSKVTWDNNAVDLVSGSGEGFGSLYALTVTREAIPDYHIRHYQLSETGVLTGSTVHSDPLPLVEGDPTVWGIAVDGTKLLAYDVSRSGQVRAYTYDGVNTPVRDPSGDFLLGGGGVRVFAQAQGVSAYILFNSRDTLHFNGNSIDLTGLTGGVDQASSGTALSIRPNVLDPDNLTVYYQSINFGSTEKIFVFDANGDLVSEKAIPSSAAFHPKSNMAVLGTAEGESKAIIAEGVLAQRLEVAVESATPIYNNTGQVTGVTPLEQTVTLSIASPPDELLQARSWTFDHEGYRYTMQTMNSASSNPIAGTELSEAMVARCTIELIEEIE